MNKINPNLIDEVHDLLNSGVSEVFNTMLALEAKPAAPHGLLPPGEHVAGSIGFTGAVSGVVHIHVTATFARTLASRMLGLAEAEVEGDEMVNDVLGELCNMIVGSVQSRLCDLGALCVLTIPSIVRGQDIEIEPACSAERRVLGFRCGADPVLAELLMKQEA